MRRLIQKLLKLILNLRLNPCQPKKCLVYVNCSQTCEKKFQYRSNYGRVLEFADEACSYVFDVPERLCDIGLMLVKILCFGIAIVCFSAAVVIFLGILWSIINNIV